MNILNKGELKYSFQLLNSVEILQKQLREKDVQSKYIVDKLKSVLSSQTVYTTLQALVKNGYLSKKEKGKFTFYKITNKGIDLLNDIRESNNKSVVRPFVESIVNTLREKYPKEFQDISDRDLSDYLYKKINKLEESIIKDVVINFTK